MTEDGRLYTDPTTGATIFDTGERAMPLEADDPIPVDEDGRGSAFPLSEEAAAFVPQATPQAAAPGLAPPAAAAQPADVQELVRTSEVALHVAQRAQAEAQGHYQEAASRAQRVATRRSEAERDWPIGDLTPESVTKFVVEQDQDSRAAAHHMSQAQAKMNEARAYGTTGEAHSMWAAIRARIPNVDENSPALGKLASDLWTRRSASGFRTPYSVLLDEHLTTMRDHFGAGASPGPGPAASAESNRISPEDARTFGLA